jgi:hypothetical protein
MDYILHYRNLIKKAKTRPKIDNLMELHHIVPKSICIMRGKSSQIYDKSYNTVYLTYKEHFIAHLLLRKIAKLYFTETPEYFEKMALALGVMGGKNKKLYKHSRLYERIKAERIAIFTQMVIDNHKKNVYKHNHTQNHKDNMSITKSKRVMLYFKDGSCIEIENISKWAGLNGYNSSKISDVLYGRRKLHKDIIKVEELEKLNYNHKLKPYYEKINKPRFKLRKRFNKTCKIKYTSTKSHREKISAALSGQKHDVQRISKNRVGHIKNNYKVYFECGQTTCVNTGLNEFCKEHNFNNGAIYAMLNNKLTKYKNVVRVERIIL